MTTRLKIAIVEDHDFWREALVGLITKLPKLNLVSTSTNGSDFIKQLQAASHEFHPEILVTDLSMPVMDGLELSKWLRQHHPNIKVIVMTLSVNLPATVRLLRAGVKGFLDKNITADTLSAAIDIVGKGDSYFSDSWTESLDGTLDSPPIKEAAIDLIEKWGSLCENERVFISLCGTEKSLTDIAIQMNIAQDLTKEISSKLFSLFSVAGRVELVKLVKECHLLED